MLVYMRGSVVAAREAHNLQDLVRLQAPQQGTILRLALPEAKANR